MNDDLKITANSTTVILTAPKYNCPKHGVVEDCVTIFKMWESKVDGEYCMECYKDLLRANLQPVTRVPVSAAAAHENSEKK